MRAPNRARESAEIAVPGRVVVPLARPSSAEPCGVPPLHALLDGWKRPVARASHVLGVLPGEGVGPEVIAAALDVLAAAAEGTPHRFELWTGGAIGHEALAASGRVLTPEVLDFCRQVFEHDGAVLCGPGGGRFVYELRKSLDLYCKLTPVHACPELEGAGPLRSEHVRGADVLFVRENMAGLYQGEHTEERGGERIRSARHVCGYSATEVARILRVAFRAAEQRRGRLAVVVKPGGVPGISALWVQEARDMASGRDVELEVLEIDNACYQVVADPRRFDVVVSPNLFGDVLADVASLLLGSRGLSYSANFSDVGAVYQTGHGAARDLAGTDTANPIGQIRSLALLVRESLGLADVADRMLRAVRDALRDGWRTPDLAAAGARLRRAPVGTRELARRIAALARRPAAMPAERCSAEAAPDTSNSSGAARTADAAAS